MADITNSYVSLTELKAWVDVTSTTYDTILSTCAVVAASQIDNYCGRSFYASGQAAARTFRGSADGRHLLVDDFTAVTSATVNGTAVTVDPVPAHNGFPYTILRASNSYFPYDDGPTISSVVVTAAWGWSAQPEIIGHANLMLAGRIFERRLSPFGIQGSPDIGLIRVTGEDRDVTAMIGPYRKLSGFIA